jgi:hypothetical protein
MIFVRNENGSHNPREAMTMDDFMAGASLLAQFLARRYPAASTPRDSSATEARRG